MCGADDDSVPMQNKEAEATFNELDATLKDIVNTVLDEAMARGHGSTSKDAVPSAALSQAPTASPYVIVPFMWLRLIGRTATSSLSSRIFRDGILILFSVQEPIADHLL